MAVPREASGVRRLINRSVIPMWFDHGGKGCADAYARAVDLRRRPATQTPVARFGDPPATSEVAGQQRGVVFDAHQGARRFGAAFSLPVVVVGVIVVGFVVVDPDASVVPVSL